VWGKEELPDILWLPPGPPDVFHILTLHPVEVARQLTLIEADIYRCVVLFSLSVLLSVRFCFVVCAVVLPPGPPDVFHILTLHPVEVARQLTLIEADIYRCCSFLLCLFFSVLLCVLLCCRPDRPTSFTSSPCTLLKSLVS
jgi:hypothetical protein